MFQRGLIYTGSKEDSRYETHIVTAFLAFKQRNITRRFKWAFPWWYIWEEFEKNILQSWEVYWVTVSPKEDVEEILRILFNAFS
jgi:hypothetical protein